MMITKDLIFALRNLSRNKLLAATNILGLSIGISACLIIFLIVSYELSFDRFQPDRDRIYRVYTSFSGSFTGTNYGISTGAAETIKEKFTGLSASANFHTFGAKVEVPGNNGTIKDFGTYSRTIITGPEYFEVFSYYQWIAGNPKQALTQPFQVVITEGRAKTYFGDIDRSEIIGREIRYQDSLVVTVSGIVKDIAKNTDLDFTDFISFSTIERSWLENNIALNNWDNTNSSSQVFVKLAPGTERSKIEDQIPVLEGIYREHTTNPEWKTTPKLQALGDIHFNTDIGIFDHSRSVSPKSTLQILIIVALVLLIIAFINFINLETAQASRHAKEVGVRKVLGSSRSKLVVRFLIQSFILSVFSVILSVVWVELSFQFFPEYFPQGLVFNVTDPLVILFLTVCSVLVTVLAGFYPAVVLSSYQPVLALKNLAHANTATSRSAFIRKTLTIFQFSFSQVLIVGTVAVGVQLGYMLNKDLGFDTDSVVTVSLPWWERPEKAQAFQHALSQIAEIDVFTMQNDPPLSQTVSTRIITFDRAGEVQRDNVQVKFGDTSYLHVYGIELLAGRNLVPKDTADEYVINEAYMRALGFEAPGDALGQVVNESFTIVGVVKDFHTRSLQHAIRPTAIAYVSDPRGIGIRLGTARNLVSDMRPGLEKVEKAWSKVYPDEKFDYTFMNEGIKRFYETETRMGQLARMATGIAILISCLGLFGLASFTVMQRTKEIGVRKVLGATVNAIAFLLSKDFLKLVALAFVLSAPVAYYLTNRWLEGFAYKMDLSAWIFLLSGLISVVIAFITISFRTISAAKADPVKSLRYE